MMKAAFNFFGKTLIGLHLNVQQCCYQRLKVKIVQRAQSEKCKTQKCAH